MQRSWLRSTVLGSVLVFAFVACGDDGGDDDDDTPDAASDGGDAGRDAGDAGRDGGGFDGGDAGRDGGDIDSGTPNDGAVDMDTSITPNEGGPGDTGTPVDTGAPADAGEDASPVDGGIDAGDEDSGTDAGEDASDDAGPPVTFADVYDDVIAGTCTGSNCHDSDEPRAGLDLSSASVAYDELVGDLAEGGMCADGQRVRVVAGEPDESLLLLKVEPNPPCGSRMPAGGMSVLPDDEIALIRAWIEQGALEGP